MSRTHISIKWTYHLRHRRLPEALGGRRCGPLVRTARSAVRDGAALHVGIPLLLGSWYGLLAVPVFMIGIARRAVSEERLLCRELAGCSEYMKRVRHRLIPGVW